MKKYELGMYEKAVPGDLSWEEKFIFAKSCGYDYIEISIDEKEEKLARLDWTDKERYYIIELMHKYDMPLRSMCLSGHRRYPMGSNDKVTEEKGLEIMEKAVMLAADLGIRTIQLAGYDVYYEESSKETDSRFKNNLHKAVDMAAKAGVMLGFETMETEYMNTVSKAMKHVLEINSPYLGVYPDSGNITNAALLYGTDVIDDLKSGAGHIIALHLKETVPGVFREVPFGTGHVNFEVMIDQAWKLGVKRFVTEFWYTGSKTWKEDAHHARQMMGDILDKKQ